MSEDEEKATGVVLADKRGLAHRSASLAKRGLESLSQLPWKSKSLFNGSSYWSSVSPFGQACTGRAVKVAYYENAYYADHLFYEHVIEIANLDGTDSLTLSAPAAFPYVEQGKQWAVATAPTCFAWSPSGRYLVTGSDNHEVALRLFDVEERRFVDCFGRHGDRLSHLAWSASGEYIASASHDYDPHLKLWQCGRSDGLFGRVIGAIDLSGEAASVEGFPKLNGFGALAFSPTSNQLAAVLYTPFGIGSDLITILEVPTLREVGIIITEVT